MGEWRAGIEITPFQSLDSILRHYQTDSSASKENRSQQFCYLPPDGYMHSYGQMVLENVSQDIRTLGTLRTRMRVREGPFSWLFFPHTWVLGLVRAGVTDERPVPETQLTIQRSRELK